jgi:hypothetical protein
LIVDVKDIVLRLQCRCGTAVTITLAKLVKDRTVKDAIYHCPNCENTFPGTGGPRASGPVSAFVNALQAVVEADLNDCHVQFEIKRQEREAQ